MSKFTPSLVGSGYQTTAIINANFTTLQTLLDTFLSRDGTSPNPMLANLDMNSNRIINLPSPVAGTDAARWLDVTNAILPTGLPIPSVTGNSGKYISTDGSTLIWSASFPVVSATSGLTIPALQNGYVLTNNGTALSWISLSAFGLVSDSNPTLGADMTTAGFKIKFTNNTGLYDSNGNLILQTNLTASAVNYITALNNSTGHSPILGVDGSDANIDLGFQTKGTGVYKFNASATAPTEVRFYEQTTNGSEYVAVKAPATLTGNRDVVWPDSDISSFVVQRSSFQTGALATGTTIIPNDDTPPQNTEGDLYMSLAHTPKNASNILVIEVVCNSSHTATTSNWQTVALFKNTDASALACVDNTTYGGNLTNMPTNFKHVMSAGTTSTLTFKVRAGNNSAGTTTFNGWSGNRKYGGVYASSIHITEYSA